MVAIIGGLGLLLGYLAWPKIEAYLGNKETPTVVAPPDVTDNVAGKTYPIKRIQVLKGDYFDITISEEKSDKRILGKLSVLATEDSKTKVLDLMNHCSQPKVTLKSKDSEGRWIVEINFVHESKEVNLTQWLTQNGLTYK
jgi:xanthosine utilization system XapX-like protein